MSIKIRKRDASTIPLPDGVYVNLFVDSDGLPKIKDSDGNVTQLSQSAVLSLVEQGISPSAEANKFKVYGKDVAGNTELFFKDSSGNEIQVTDGGGMAGGGAAAALLTTGAPVSLTSATPPVIYQSLVAANATTAVWFYPFAGSLLSNGGTHTIGISSAANPVAGQALVATSASAAAWSNIGLTQDLTVHHSGFTAVLNTVHYVAIGDAVDKTVTLPTPLADGDEIEIVAIGSGSDQISIDPNGNDINWAGFAFTFVWHFSGAGLHLKLRWSTDDNTWTSISDDVASRFGSNPSPMAHSIIFSESDGRTNTQTIRDDSLIGRVNGGQIEAVLYKTLVLANDFTVTSASLADVTGFSYSLPTFPDTYCFEFHLGISQSVGTGIVGVSAQVGSSSNFLQHATLIKADGSASAFSTNGSNTTPGTAIVDAAARSIGGPFETIVRGSFVAGSVGPFSLQAQRSAGTTVIKAGSWGRVWKATGV